MVGSAQTFLYLPLIYESLHPWVMPQILKLPFLKSYLNNLLLIVFENVR